MIGSKLKSYNSTNNNYLNVVSLPILCVSYTILKKFKDYIKKYYSGNAQVFKIDLILSF